MRDAGLQRLPRHTLQFFLEYPQEIAVGEAHGAHFAAPTANELVERQQIVEEIRLGVILLDLDDPSRVVGQCPEFILTPREEYERVGEVVNCVFANGAIPEPDGTVKVYYGAADTCIGLATGNLNELVHACRCGVKPVRPAR